MKQKMAKVVSILDYRAKQLQRELAPSTFNNIYDFLIAHYGESTNEQVIEILATLYRKMCDVAGEELDYSIMINRNKIRRELRKF